MNNTNGRPCNTATDTATLTRKFDAITGNGNVSAIVLAVFTDKGWDVLHVEGKAIQTLIRLIAKAAV